MAENCTCGDYTLSLLGRPGCVQLQKQTVRLAWMHKYDAQGVRNFIDTSGGVFNAAFWNTYLTNADASKRLYLTSVLENVTHPVTERQTQEFESGKEIETRPEYLGFEGFAVEKDATSELYGEYKRNKCADLVFFHIDKNGNFIGDATDWASDKLYGIPVQSGTFNLGRMLATDSETNMIRIGFKYDPNFDDAKMNGIGSGFMADQILSIPAVTRVNGVVTAPTIANFVITLNNIFVQGLGFDPIEGLVAANFDLFEDDGTTPVAIASVVEGADGVYTVTATMPAGDYIVALDLGNHLMAPITFTTA